ncbi:LmbE family N-acetylglucosaminyl deacetylase [Catalinimonas alkaloidigena]|uniref:PIG-L deacetylase family protein n=1 Tax=Catalinimonas alkaloidigena TaxID=1075417 RepID=UPI0024077378|nr:PIG-L family deacetylase [Catalinimonas alkaloidigena]MDF9797740.1 LmbE family N-acetylglucosaminyl deacetylase [Catalinimonas alkaloidigena]
MTSGKKNVRHSQHEIAIRPLLNVYEWGTTLVIASRTNTDIMGCGSAIALLRQMGYRVHVMFICDAMYASSDTHNIPLQCLKDLRKYEAKSALSKLGVSEESITFMDIGHASVPSVGQDSFNEIVSRCKQKFKHYFPDTVLIPWRFDQVKDYVAIKRIIHSALQQEACYTNIIEYAQQPWIDESQIREATESDLKLLQLDSKEVLEYKLEALSQYHEEDISLLKDDVITLNALNRESLSYMTHPWEIFLQTEGVA